MTPEQWLKVVEAAYTVCLLLLGRGDPLDKIDRPRELTEGEFRAVLDAARRQVAKEAP